MSIVPAQATGPHMTVINRGGGWAAMMQEVCNLLGVREETSGVESVRV